jgi:hypothetical protein
MGELESSFKNLLRLFLDKSSFPKDVDAMRIAQIIAAIDKCPYDVKTRKVIVEPWAISQIAMLANLLYNDSPYNDRLGDLRRIIEFLKSQQNPHLELSLNKEINKFSGKNAIAINTAFSLAQLIAYYGIRGSQTGLVAKLDPALVKYHKIKV